MEDDQDDPAIETFNEALGLKVREMNAIPRREVFTKVGDAYRPWFYRGIIQHASETNRILNSIIEQLPWCGLEVVVNINAENDQNAFTEREGRRNLVRFLDAAVTEEERGKIIRYRFVKHLPFAPNGDGYLCESIKCVGFMAQFMEPISVHIDLGDYTKPNEFACLCADEVESIKVIDMKEHLGVEAQERFTPPVRPIMMDDELHYELGYFTLPSSLHYLRYRGFVYHVPNIPSGWDGNMRATASSLRIKPGALTWAMDRKGRPKRLWGVVGHLHGSYPDIFEFNDVPVPRRVRDYDPSIIAAYLIHNSFILRNYGIVKYHGRELIDRLHSMN